MKLTIIPGFNLIFLKSCLSSFEASSLDRIKMTKNGLEYDQKNWQRRTLTLELDQNFTTTNVNLWTRPKYRWIWLKIYLLCISTSQRVLRTPFAGWNQFFDAKTTFCIILSHKINFRSYPPIHVCRCGNIYYIFGQVHHVNCVLHFTIVVLLKLKLNIIKF